MLRSRTFRTWDGSCGKKKEDPSRRCNARDLTLPNVFVIASKVGGTPIHEKWNFGVPEDPALLDQVRCSFEPHVIGLMAGPGAPDHQQ
ncbi:MAG: hypothetical protein ACE5F1_10655 [Planctomycetota bacterium]